MHIAARSLAAGMIVLLGLCLIVGAIRQDADQRSAQYFIGECSVTSPRGDHVGDMVLLTARLSDPANSRINEQIISISSSGQPVAEHSLLWTVSGNTARTAEEGGARSSGTATLNGEAWKWSSFDYDLQMGDGSGTIHKHADFSPEGMVVETKFIAADGNARVTITEHHRPISKETFDLLRGKLVATTQPAGGQR